MAYVTCFFTFDQSFTKMAPMKRAILLSTCFLLAACGGGSSRGVSCEQHYWDGSVGTCLPDGWDVLDGETLRQRGVPEETIVGFQLAEAVSGQFPTVAITREKLANVVDPAKYSEANIRSVEVLAGYKLMDSKEFIVDGEKVTLHVFTGQPIEGEPSRRFYQVSTTLEDVGYTMTAVTPLSIDDSLEKQVTLMLENFTLVEPVVEEE